MPFAEKQAADRPKGHAMNLVLAPQQRRELIRTLISSSPYRRVLTRYEQEIDRIAAGHAQISQIMAEVYPRQAVTSRRLGRNPRVKEQLRLLQDFLEFVYFSTPEAYKGISGAR